MILSIVFHMIMIVKIGKTYNGTDWIVCDTPDIFN